MKEELHQRAATPPLDKTNRVQQIYNDLITSMTAGKSFDDACKELSLEPQTIWRGLLPSEGFIEEWRAFISDERTESKAAIASLRDTAVIALQWALLNPEHPHAARLAYLILRDFAGQDRDGCKPPTKGRAKPNSRLRKKRPDRKF